MKRNRNDIVKDDDTKKPKEGEVIFNLVKNGKTALSRYFPQFLSETEANELYDELYALKDIHFNRDVVSTPRGKVKAPRWTAAFGEEGIVYGYAGMERETVTEWPKLLLECKKRIEKKLGCELNYGFVNIYEITDKDGNVVEHYIGWHSDSEGDIVTTKDGETTICSISVGDERTFQLRETYKVGKEKPTPIISKVLEHGSLCTMEKQTQKFCKHQVKKKSGAKKPRINITFRKMKKRKTK